jgi:hypothetical protein
MSDNPDRDASIAYHYRRGRTPEWIAGAFRLPAAIVRQIIRREVGVALAPPPPLLEAIRTTGGVPPVPAPIEPARPRARRLGDQDPIGCLERLGLGAGPWRYCQRPTLPGCSRCDQHGGRQS